MVVMLLWPVTSIAVLAWGVLTAFIYWPIAVLARRRNRGEDDLVPVETEVALVWIPVLGVAGAVGVTYGFLPQVENGWIFVTGAVCGVAALSVTFARQVGEHHGGNSPFMFAPDVRPDEALREAKRGERRSVWLVEVAQEALRAARKKAALDHAAAAAAIARNEAGASGAVERPQPMPSVRGVVVSVLLSLLRGHKVILLVSVLWALAMTATLLSDRSSVVLFASAVSSWAGLLFLGVSSYLDFAVVEYQRMRRQLALERKVDADAALNDRKRADATAAERASARALEVAVEKAIRRAVQESFEPRTRDPQEKAEATRLPQVSTPVGLFLCRLALHVERRARRGNFGA